MGVFFLRNTAEEFGLLISPHKNVMLFMGKYPVRTKTEINGQILEQKFSFNYLACNIPPTVDCGVKNKLNRFKHICGTIH